MRKNHSKLLLQVGTSSLLKLTCHFPDHFERRLITMSVSRSSNTSLHHQTGWHSNTTCL